MLNNEEIAGVLSDISELLEILEEDPFKVRAYRNAAAAVRSSPLPVASLALDGRLTELKGVGKSIAARIEELVRTGRVAYLDELSERIPASILSLTEVPGIGPRTARLIFETLGIADRAALAEAIETGALKRVKGIGAKTVQSIRKGLEMVRQAESRFLLSEAEAAAQSLEQAVARVPGVVEARVAGSVRRLRETVGDIDLVASVDDAGAVVARLRDLPSLRVESVGAAGDATVVRGTFRNRFPVEIGLAPRVDSGLHLVLATGSSEHLNELRDAAAARGATITDRGLFVDGQRVPAPTEEAVYGAAGCSVVPPYLREGRGEVAAALAGRLPEPLARERVKGDLHVHSTWSDSASSLEEIAEAAAQLGYEYVAVTDHAKRLRVAQGLVEDELAERLDEIAAVNRRFAGRVTLLSGIELNIDRDGALDYDDDVLARFDFVIASVHWGFSEDARDLTRRVVRAMENPHVHTIGHPSGRLLLRRDPYELDYDAVFRAAAETNTAIEINSFPDRLDITDVLARRAYEEYGVRFSIGTDAHSVAHLPFIRYGLAVAMRAWLPEAAILNFLPLAALREALREGGGR